jgi:hypothetical protein
MSDTTKKLRPLKMNKSIMDNLYENDNEYLYNVYKSMNYYPDNKKIAYMIDKENNKAILGYKNGDIKEVNFSKFKATQEYTKVDNCLSCVQDRTKVKKHTYKECMKCFLKERENILSFCKDNMNYDIDILNYGGYRKTIYCLFYSIMEKKLLKIKFEIVKSEEEYKILENTTRGAYSYAKKQPYVGEIFLYDVNSMYPYFFLTQQFPYKTGELLKIKQTELNEMIKNNNIKYGCYHCIIHNINFMHMRDNKYNWYNHIDLQRAVKLNYKIEMIEDNNTNFLYYSDDKLCNIFDDYVKLLYEMKLISKEKKEDIPNRFFKICLSSIWGYFTQNGIMKTNIISDDDKLIGIDNNTGKAIVRNDFYNSESMLPRLKTFLLSMGRSYLCSYISDYHLEDILIRSHTDSLFLLEKIDNIIKPSNKIGDFKLDICYVYSINKTTYYKLNKLNDSEYEQIEEIEEINIEI